MFIEGVDPVTIKIIGQLTLSTVLGMLIGIERQRRGKPAGLRTYTLVALGSTLFTAISLNGGLSGIGAGGYDPSRLASQVVVGIGFIGAGMIFLKEDSVFGLTTAAGLWATAAVGMAIGFSLYAVAI